MHQNPRSSLQCDQCGSLASHCFDLTRSRDRTHFYARLVLPEVEVSQAEVLGTYCSLTCRSLNLRRLMANEGVPIPAVSPDIGPVEVCTRCNRLVDTTEFHLTYTLCEGHLKGSEFNPVDVDYLAVVCPACEAGIQQREALVPPVAPLKVEGRQLIVDC